MVNRYCGQVALDELRLVDWQRLLRKLANVSVPTARVVSSPLVEMFSRE